MTRAITRTAEGEHVTHTDIALGMVSKDGLLQTLAKAFAAGRHGEVSFEEWLDNTIRAVYRDEARNEARRRRNQARRENGEQVESD